MNRLQNWWWLVRISLEGPEENKPCSSCCSSWACMLYRLMWRCDDTTDSWLHFQNSNIYFCHRLLYLKIAINQRSRMVDGNWGGCVSSPKMLVNMGNMCDGADALLGYKVSLVSCDYNSTTALYSVICTPFILLVTLSCEFCQWYSQ